MKSRVIVIFLLAILIAIVFNITLGLVVDKLFLEELYKDTAMETVNNLNTNQASADDIEIDIKWPWHIRLLYTIILTIFWFIWAKIVYAISFCKNRYLYLLSPLVVHLLFLDIFFPVYILFCYFGGKGAALEN